MVFSLWYQLHLGWGRRVESCFDPGDARTIQIPCSVLISVAAVLTRDIALDDPKPPLTLNDAY